MGAELDQIGQDNIWRGGGEGTVGSVVWNGLLSPGQQHVLE